MSTLISTLTVSIMAELAASAPAAPESEVDVHADPNITINVDDDANMDVNVEIDVGVKADVDVVTDARIDGSVSIDANVASKPSWRQLGTSVSVDADTLKQMSV